MKESIRSASLSHHVARYANSVARCANDLPRFVAYSDFTKTYAVFAH
jgi:hypothetical protein